MEERLQKILSRAGYGSRRACEELILAGRVRVNGRTAQIGEKADVQKDQISLDGKIIAAAEGLVYIALHKPRYVLSTVEAPDARKTVIDLVPVNASVYPVGRLDFESEGLILLTNDGDLANRLTHPRYGQQKEYRVLVARQPDAEQLEAFRHGVVLEDGHRTAPAEVRVESLFGKGAWLNVVLREGRKRQIRETCMRIGLPVVRILRVRIGSLRLGSLKSGEWRYLSAEEVQALKDPASVKPTGGRRQGGAKPSAQKPAAYRKDAGQRQTGNPKTGNRPYRKPADKPIPTSRRRTSPKASKPFQPERKRPSKKGVG